MRRFSPHIVFAGGVTGGHLFPGLAVAGQLLARDSALRITFAGPGSKFDRLHVRQAGFDYVAIEAPRWPHSLTQLPNFGLTALRGFRQAAQFLREQRVSAVVGLGGYASVPMASAAARGGVPLVLLEQNAVLGRANRFLGRFAARICLSFEQTDRLPALSAAQLDRRVRITGTPVRPLFSLAARSLDVDAEDAELVADSAVRRPTLLILGGSSGARQLNQALPTALAPLRTLLTAWRVVHQSGADDVTQTALAYDAAGIKATVAPFFYDLPAVMARSDLAICRAGGSTLAELSIAGVPAILVPLATATDGHQHANARVYAARGAARIVEASHAGAATPLADRLSRELFALLRNPIARELMAAKMRRCGRPQAAQEIAELILNLVAKRGSPGSRRGPYRLDAPSSIDIPTPHAVPSRTARTPPSAVSDSP